MNPTPQAGYTCTKAAGMAMKKLEPGVKHGRSRYAKRHQFYLQRFSHYSLMYRPSRVRDKVMSNRFVETLIKFWKGCPKGERPELTYEDIDTMMKNPRAVKAIIVDKTLTVSVAEAAILLKLTPKTVMNYMDRLENNLEYILIGDERKPLKAQVYGMMPFYKKPRFDGDSEVYRRYFEKQGVFQVGRSKKGYPKQITVIFSANKRLQKELSAAHAEKRNLEVKVDKAENTKERLQEEKAALRKDRNKWKAKYGRLDRQNARLQNQYAALEVETKNLLERIAEYQEAAKAEPKYGDPTKSQEYQNLLKQKETADAQVRQLTKQYEQTNKRAENLDTQVTDLEEKVRDLTSDNKDLTERLTAIKAEDKDKAKDQDYKLLEQERDELAKQMEELQSANRDLRAKKPAHIKQTKSSGQKGKEPRIYRRYDETYSKGDKIEHTSRGQFGQVVASSSTSIAILFDGEEEAIKFAIGKKPNNKNQ